MREAPNSALSVTMGKTKAPDLNTLMIKMWPFYLSGFQTVSL